MFRLVRKLGEIISKVPGEERFGFYRFLPVFFLVGAGLEYTMIKWEPGGVNFYKTFLKRRVHEDAIWELRILGEIDDNIDL